MTGEQAAHIVKRFEALGWRSQVRGSGFDVEEFVVDASDWPGEEFYTCRQYFRALELLAILRARASGQPSSRADELIAYYERRESRGETA